MAFRRFRRRRRAVQWFPPIGTVVQINQDTTRTTPAVTFELDVTNGGEIVIDLPLTFDFGTEEIESFASENVPTMTLSDLQSSSWRCRRIVGKLFASYIPLTLGDNEIISINGTPTAVHFAAGLMVRRVEGVNSAAVAVESPLRAEDSRDPWIWQRNWVLGQGASVNVAQAGFPGGLATPLFTNRPIGFIPASQGERETAFSFFPKTNTEYGSVLDGPHVDAKTNRIIGPEERLFLTLATQKLPLQPGTSGLNSVGKVIGMYTFRLLGHMMRSTNRRNASR